jgi:hypothetical protein
MSQPAETILLRRIRAWTLAFIFGLLLSGATAIPLQAELDWLVRATGAGHIAGGHNSVQEPAWSIWLGRVHSALSETSNQSPFLYYGTDWLAFGHFVIAIAFIGALIDPVRNKWLFRFGIISCVLVIPYALMFGAIRGIPLWWRLVDCSFGLFGLIPLWFCCRWVRKLEELLQSKSSVVFAPSARTQDHVSLSGGR